MDPRIERTRLAVRRATLTVLAERGFATFTVEAVAAAAGVSKSTIYRHWPSKLALIADALEALNEQPVPALSGVTAREKVEELLEHLVAAFSDPVLSACIPALMEAAERHPEVGDFLYAYSARRRETLVDVLRVGIDEGELRSDLDPELGALVLSGAIMYRRTMTSEPFRAPDIPALIDLVVGPVAIG